MKLKQLVCLATLATPLSVNADFLSVSAGGGVWNETPDGNIQKTIDAVNVDIKNNLFWEEETQGYFFITVEHPVPVIPNVKFMSTKLDQSGSGATNFTFDGLSFSGPNVSNDFSIETLDFMAYYEVLDNIVSLDLGLNVRHLKIDYNINNGSSTTDSVSATVPMLYAAVGASPYPELLISGEVSYIAYDGNSLSDFTAKIAYTTNFLLGFEAGYRKLSFELDDVSDTNANIDFDGVFAGAYLKF